MAKIEALTFGIERTSFPGGHICNVVYSYYLHIDPQQYQHGDSFNVVVELHGDDVIYDRTLGERFYDAHVLDRNIPMPVERRFIVPCEALDESLGNDRIYMKLLIKSSEGELLAARSGTVVDRF